MGAVKLDGWDAIRRLRLGASGFIIKDSHVKQAGSLLHVHHLPRPIYHWLLTLPRLMTSLPTHPSVSSLASKRPFGICGFGGAL